MFSILFGAALLAAQPETEATSAEAVTTADSAAWVEATANRAKVKTRPSLTEGTFPLLPEGEKALGHHGEAVVSGILTSEGRLVEARVSQSSGVAELDRIALAAAESFRFSPAKDADGGALPIVAAIPFTFADYAEGDGMAGTYRCQQFLLDLAWWQSANPDKPIKKHELYNMMLGLQTIVMMNAGKAGDAGKGVAVFDARWNKAFDRCSKKPDALLLQVLFG